MGFILPLSLTFQATLGPQMGDPSLFFYTVPVKAADIVLEGDKIWLAQDSYTHLTHPYADISGAQTNLCPPNCWDLILLGSSFFL